MIKKIALTGVCEFECWKCKLNKKCSDYNDRHNDNVNLDQTEIRKQFATEYLLKLEFDELHAEGLKVNLRF